ncbi:hypothetical protein [Sphingomonas sp. UBA978]|uniref:type II toxin-antitoxin system RelE/ParE family toxin n=1 Tax=unclassified Sphingomonas TaxID=196159 RepID=UPI0032E46600
MILTFADSETDRVWQGQSSRKLPPDVQRTARRKLRQINRIGNPADMRVPPGNRF